LRCYYFNQQVNNLPENLTHLTFGVCFNQSVDNLPKKLSYLTFGIGFYQQVDNLPESLTHLKLYCKNNKIIIPKNVSELYICDDNMLINNIPKNIEKLYIYFVNLYYKNIQNLPITLKEIVIEKEEYKKYLIKIPFDTVIIIKKIE
jgi:hypothetical protein